MFLAQFLLKKKKFLSASALIFFPRNVNSTTRPKPLKKPTCTGINLVPRDDVLDNEAKAPEKNLAGALICSLHKKSGFLASAKRN